REYLVRNETVPRGIHIPWRIEPNWGQAGVSIVVFQIAILRFERLYRRDFAAVSLDTARLLWNCVLPFGRVKPQAYDCPHVQSRPVREKLRPETFDVICAGQPLWRGSMPSLGHVAGGASSAFINVTKMLPLSSLHVGCVAVLEDDRRGRALLAETAAINA